MTAGEPILCEKRGAQGRILLNRPEKLNALDLSMIEAIDRQLAIWAEDPDIAEICLTSSTPGNFCAGGDVRQLAEARDAGDMAYVENFFRREYALIHRLAHYPKPSLAVIDGPFLGGGAGLAMHCRHRAITQNARFAMPECRIGLIPDVGAARFLGRCPGAMGLFLALSGISLGSAGLHAIGLAESFVPNDRIDFLDMGLIGKLAMKPPPPPIAAFMADIEAVFSLPRLTEMLTVLAARKDRFGRDTFAALSGASPLSLALTFRHMQEGRDLTLAALLQRDFRLMMRLAASPDFSAGMRALLIERKGAPSWSWPDLAGIPESEIERHFVPLEHIAEWQAAA